MLSNRTLGALSLSILVAITAASVRAIAQNGQPTVLSMSSCPSGSSAFTTTRVNGGVHATQLAHASLHQAEATLYQVAKHVISNPRLFAFEVSFEEGFTRREPRDAGFYIAANYASPCDQTQYLRIGRSLNHRDRRPEDQIGFIVTPFLPPYSCYGNAPAFAPSPPPPVAEPESRHPPVQGWTVDLSELWRVAKTHQNLFANGVKSCRLTTAMRLEEDDNKPQCGTWTVFNVPPSWNGRVTPELQQRLRKEQGHRTVVELVETGLAVPRSGASACEWGHYLIIDAYSGADVESGTYLYCPSSPA